MYLHALDPRSFNNVRWMISESGESLNSFGNISNELSCIERHLWIFLRIYSIRALAFIQSFKPNFRTPSSKEFIVTHLIPVFSDILRLDCSEFWLLIRYSSSYCCFFCDRVNSTAEWRIQKNNTLNPMSSVYPINWKWMWDSYNKWICRRIIYFIFKFTPTSAR